MANKKNWLGMLVMILAFGMTVIGCDNGTTDVEKTPEEKTTAERWGKWVDDSSSVTINYSVDNSGVCAITVSGTPEANEWDRWKGNCGYEYTGKRDTHYTYVLEAWTENGDRTINFQYFGGGDLDTGGGPYLSELLYITDTRTTYTFVGDTLSRGGVIPLEIQCADQLGTFFIKIVSITEGGETTTE